jgi:Fe-S-cluster-containing hydrogenase component 2
MACPISAVTMSKAMAARASAMACHLAKGRDGDQGNRNGEWGKERAHL